MKYNCCQVSFSVLKKLNCLFGSLSRNVSKRDSSMTALVIVHAGPNGGLQEKSPVAPTFISKKSNVRSLMSNKVAN